MLPGGMVSLIDKVSHCHNTRGARSNFYVEHVGSRSIKSIAPGIWNALPLELKQRPSVAAFKEASKMGLLAHYSSFVCTVPRCRSCNV